MTEKFKVEFLEEVFEFMDGLDKKARDKILFNMATLTYTHSIRSRTQKTMKTYTLDEVKDRYLGKKGTAERDAYENELRLDLIGEAIKQARKKRELTQTQLGELIGVKKAQISKIENNLTDAKFETILKVFRVLDAKINFNVELLNQKIDLATKGAAKK